MIKMVKIFFIITFTFLCFLNIKAQHNHGNGGGMDMGTMTPKLPPHGGEVKDAGKYKIEMVTDIMLKKDQLTFFLLKGNLKPISTEGITGSVTIEQKEGTSVTEDLLIKGDERFVGQLKNTKSFQANVKFIVKGKTVSAIFIHYGLGHKTGIKYTCSMHPEIESDEPGKCPKCGMTLIKK